jgi:YgiT-type zinc finger domain-containing protein
MLEIKTCPTCGSPRFRRVRRDWKSEFKGEAYVVRDLEYFECENCGERLYDRDAMRRIEKVSPAYSKMRAKQ